MWIKVPAKCVNVNADVDVKFCPGILTLALLKQMHI